MVRSTGKKVGMKEEARPTAESFSKVDVRERRRVGHQDVRGESPTGLSVGHVGRQVAAVHDL